jgi:hypothetical protein
MYKHLVLWKMKESANGMSRAELAAEVKSRLGSLVDVIPEIQEYEVGINIGAYGASFFDVGLISAFENEEAFKRYCVYPEHDAVVAYIQSVTNAEEIVDYVV